MPKRALVLIDIQNDYFPGGKWTLRGIDAAAENAAKLLAAARAAGDLVVHVRHEFPTADAPFFAPGSEGAKIHPKVRSLPLVPVPDEDSNQHQTSCRPEGRRRQCLVHHPGVVELSWFFVMWVRAICPASPTPTPSSPHRPVEPSEPATATTASEFQF
jgi:hypothetical protein